MAILNGYNGGVPFSHYLKQYFASRKKYGSKDRRQIAGLCYQYFRLGRSLPGMPVAEKLLHGVFLCSRQPSPLLAALRPSFNEQVHLPVSGKLELLGLRPFDLFPFSEALSPAVSAEDFALSMLAQPLLFLRLRPGFEAVCCRKMTDAGIAFTMKGSHCMAVANSAAVDKVLDIDREAVVQDFSSQRVGEFFTKYIPPQPAGRSISVWDCCAASGGKSLLLYDLLQGRVQLTVSDVRSSILHNLDQRFAKAGIKKFISFTADLAAGESTGKADYDVIICDAPCTGSGTWARTPEQLCFAGPEQVAHYAALQHRIAAAALTRLKPGGLFFYITCSVFEQENEARVSSLQQQGLQLLHMQLLDGWEQQADSMFVAVMQLPSV